jgi:hypothetical protein
MVNNKTAASASTQAQPPPPTTSTAATAGGGWSQQSQSTLNNSQPLPTGNEYPKTKLISSSSAGTTTTNNKNVSPTRSTFFVKSASMRTTFNIGRRVSTGDEERHTNTNNSGGGSGNSGNSGGRGLLKTQLSFRRLSLPEDGKKVDHDGEF